MRILIVELALFLIGISQSIGSVYSDNEDIHDIAALVKDEFPSSSEHENHFSFGPDSLSNNSKLPEVSIFPGKTTNRRREDKRVLYALMLVIAILCLMGVSAGAYISKLRNQIDNLNDELGKSQNKNKANEKETNQLRQELAKKNGSIRSMKAEELERENSYKKQTEFWEKLAKKNGSIRSMKAEELEEQKDLEMTERQRIESLTKMNNALKLEIQLMNNERLNQMLIDNMENELEMTERQRIESLTKMNNALKAELRRRRRRRRRRPRIDDADRKQREQLLKGIRSLTEQLFGLEIETELERKELERKELEKELERKELERKAEQELSQRMQLLDGLSNTRLFLRMQLLDGQIKDLLDLNEQTQ